MQDPNEDTEWNDVLRRHGILPDVEVTQEQIEALVDEAVRMRLAPKDNESKSLHELTRDVERTNDADEEDELAAIRRRRLADLVAERAGNRFGDLLHIGKEDYVREVNEAGKDVWVVLHLYQESVRVSALLNHHLANLARKFAATKFVKIKSTDCIPNYPDRNLPTVFVYVNGDLKHQAAGLNAFPLDNMTLEDLEWMIASTGAIKTTMIENPRDRKSISKEAKKQQFRKYDDSEDDYTDDSFSD